MKLTGLIATSIKNEQSYQEHKRIDWLFTKKVMRQFLEDLFPQGTTVYCGAGSITIRVPWGINNLREARKAIGSGWRFSGNWTDNSGTLTKSYYRSDDSLPADTHQYRPSVFLSLIMDATELDPETCKKIEVGEKVFTQKIYKVICDDGVQEIAGAAEELDNIILEVE
jgi:hypothetical protein